MDGDNIFIQECLKEALGTLKHYRTDPFIDRFMKRFGIDTKGTQSQKLAAIEAKVLEPISRPTFKDLSDYLDELKWFGKQHIFMFSLKGIHSDYIDKLRDAAYIIEKLELSNSGDLFNNDKLVWEDTEPVLAGVTYSFDAENQEGQLIYKWVETREFQVIKMVPKVGNVVTIEKERAANFFVINLNDGTAELRIQSLQPKSLKSLEMLVNTYKTEINRFINIDHFAPVVMEPIIRGFLRKKVLPVRGFKIEYPGKHIITGNWNISLYFRLSLLFRPFFSKEMRVYWECEQECRNNPRLFFTLNGDSDEIRFNSISDKSKVNFVLKRLRELTTELMKMDELKYLAMLDSQHTRILSGIDFLFVGLKKLKIEVEELSSMVWYPKNVIKDVFKTIAAMFPEKFYLEGKDLNVLVIRNCLTLRGGLNECIKRQLEKSRHKEILKPIVTFTLLSVGPVILQILGNDASNWILENMVNKILPGIPLFLIKAVGLLLMAVFLFGTTNIFRKIPKNVYNFFLILFQGFIGNDILKERFEANIGHAHTNRINSLLPFLTVLLFLLFSLIVKM